MSANICCLVVPRIIKHLPYVEINQSTFNMPPNINLADQEFYKRRVIDMLTRAEFFFDWLKSERIELGNNLPILQNTKIGWVVAGAFSSTGVASSSSDRGITTLTCLLKPHNALDNNLRKFRELEGFQFNANQTLSKESRECNEFFEKTTTRREDGRFVVQLPFRDNPITLGESRDIAIKKLAQLETRFRGNKTWQREYVAFMRDYLDAGRMSLVSESVKASERPIIYLPHHGVIKESCTTTKLRAVFDGSSKTSSGKSLNDLLYVETTNQGTLFEIVLRF